MALQDGLPQRPAEAVPTRDSRIEAMMDYRDDVNRKPMDALEAAQGGLSQVPAPAPPNQGVRPNMPVFVPDTRPANQGMQPVPDNRFVKQNLNEMLTATTQDGDSLAAKALETLSNKAKLNLIEMAELEDSDPEMFAAKAGGGLMQLAAGSEFSGRVPGDGHGMQDNVFMPIVEENKPIGKLAVSPTEYVVDSYTMAALGNGNAEEGADVMDEAIKQIRQKAYGSEEQPNEMQGLSALRPLIERV